MIPEIGKTYKFYDDGKPSPSRRYDAIVIDIKFPEEAKEIYFPTFYDANRDYVPTTITYNEKSIGKISLYEHWQNEVKECPWLYATETSHFIECKIPKYDENNIWFVQTKNNGWFSINIQNCWQSGLLDVDESFTKRLKKIYTDKLVDVKVNK